MKKRPSRPHRRKKSPAARLRPFWIAIFAILVLAGVGGFALASWPGFYPKIVDVDGNQRVARADILAKATIEAHKNIWLQDTRAMSQRIQKLPYVASAAVYRRPPATLIISIKERAQFAVLVSPLGSAIVDEQLRVLQFDDGTTTLPRLSVRAPLTLRAGEFVSRPDVVELRDSYLRLLAAHVVAHMLSTDKYGDLVLSMGGGISVLLGDGTDFEKKAAMIDPILTQLAAKGRPIAAIDLRAPNTPVVVYK